MKTFTVNGKEYQSRPFDFNLVCDLEDMGISLQQAAPKPMSMVRAYFCLCCGAGKEYAGKEMEAHLIAGGNFEEIMNAMTEEMEKSDFFRSITKTAKTEVTADSGKAKQKK